MDVIHRYVITPLHRYTVTLLHRYKGKVVGGGNLTRERL